MPKLLGYDFSIEYKPERENIIVDALLRSFLDFSSRQCDISTQLQQLQLSDPKCASLIQ